MNNNQTTSVETTELLPNDLEAARQLVYDLAKDGDKAWRMSVPSQSGDSDNLLLRVIDSASSLTERLTLTETRNGELERERVEMQGEIERLKRALEATCAALQIYSSATVEDDDDGE